MISLILLGSFSCCLSVRFFGVYFGIHPDVFQEVASHIRNPHPFVMETPQPSDVLAESCSRPLE